MAKKELNVGTYSILYIEVNSFWIPVGCLTENSFSESVEMIGTTTRDNTAGWKTSLPTLQQYGISFSGLVTLSDDGGSIVSYSKLREIKRDRTRIKWQIKNEKGGDVDEGSGYITDLSDTASIDNFVSFSGSITGFGEPLTQAKLGSVLNFRVTDSITPDTQIRWDSVPVANSYRVEQLSGTSLPGFPVTTIGTSINIHNTQAGRYYFRVRAEAPNYTAGSWSYLTMIAEAPQVPLAPTGFNAAQTGINTISLNWNKSIGATGYKIYDELDDSLVKTVGDVSSTELTKSNGTYTYYIVATNALGDSDKSNTSSVTVADPVETSPIIDIVERVAMNPENVGSIYGYSNNILHMGSVSQNSFNGVRFNALYTDASINEIRIAFDGSINSDTMFINGVLLTNSASEPDRYTGIDSSLTQAIKDASDTNSEIILTLYF